MSITEVSVTDKWVIFMIAEWSQLLPDGPWGFLRGVVTVLAMQVCAKASLSTCRNARAVRC